MSFGRPGRWTSPAEMTVVTPPWRPDSMKSIVRWRGVKSPKTGWAWESMSPGKAVVPWASMTCSGPAPAPSPAASPRPTAAIRPSSMRISSASRRGVRDVARGDLAEVPNEGPHRRLQARCARTSMVSGGRRRRRHPRPSGRRLERGVARRRSRRGPAGARRSRGHRGR